MAINVEIQKIRIGKETTYRGRVEEKINLKT